MPEANKNHGMDKKSRPPRYFRPQITITHWMGRYQHRPISTHTTLRSLALAPARALGGGRCDDCNTMSRRRYASMCDIVSSETTYRAARSGNPRMTIDIIIIIVVVVVVVARAGGRRTSSDN